MYKDRNDAIYLLIITLAMIPLATVINGFLIAFAWNELLVPIWGFVALSNWQGMGLSTFVSIFFTGLAKADGADDDSPSWAKIIFRAILQQALLFLIVWLVSLSY